MVSKKSIKYIPFHSFFKKFMLCSNFPRFGTVYCNVSPVNICLRYGCRELKQDFSKIEAKEKLQTYRTSAQHEIRS